MTITQHRPTAPIRNSQQEGLDWHDAVATSFVAASLLAIYATVMDWGWPLLGSVRGGAAVAVVLAFAACPAGARDVTSSSSFASIMLTLLGVAAFGIGVAAVVTRSEPVLVAFGLDVLAMWLITTSRHAVRE